MTHPTASRLRIAGMYRRAAPAARIYRVTNRLQNGRTVYVKGHQLAATISGWLAELGAHSPLVDDLARAAHAGDWPAAGALGEYLSVEVSVAA